MPERIRFHRFLDQLRALLTDELRDLRAELVGGHLLPKKESRQPNRDECNRGERKQSIETDCGRVLEGIVGIPRFSSVNRNAEPSRHSALVTFSGVEFPHRTLVSKNHRGHGADKSLTTDRDLLRRAVRNPKRYRVTHL